MITKICSTTILIAILLTQIAWAEAAQTGSAQYDLNLEKKQTLLASIKEDIAPISSPAGMSIGMRAAMCGTLSPESGLKTLNEKVGEKGKK